MTAAPDGKKLRVGLVGCGEVGIIHARAYAADPAVELVGLCDTNAALLAPRCRELDVAGYRSVEELLDKGRPDLVGIVVKAHYNRSDFVAPIRACLYAGVHVLSEKPVSFRTEDVVGLRDLARDKKVSLGINFCQRFTPASQWFRQLREQGAFGEMLWTAASYNQGWGVGAELVLKEHMIHVFDLWRYHVGEVVSVSAQVTAVRIGEDLHRGISAAAVTFGNGAAGVCINGAPLIRSCQRYQITGTGGEAVCEDFVCRAEFRPAEGPIQALPRDWFANGYWDSTSVHLGLAVESLLAGRPMPVTVDDLVEALYVAEGIVLAAEEGRCVEIKQIRDRFEATGSVSKGG